jgi:hypothetical protein
VSQQLQRVRKLIAGFVVVPSLNIEAVIAADTAFPAGSN